MGLPILVVKPAPLSSSPTFNFHYSYVCGRAVGFSYYRPYAFYFSKHGYSLSKTVEGAYVSGLSIIHGPPSIRTHIWTYAGGLQEVLIVKGF